MDKSSTIYIAGHSGMVGSAIKRKLELGGYKNLLLKSSKILDLRNQQSVLNFFSSEKPEYVFLAAAKVGGIIANNSFRADFIFENLSIQNNIIHASYLNNVKKLMFLGSSCIYPKFAPQPLKEESLLTNTLEPTNEPYAIAKIAGIKLCEAYRSQYGCDFISVMPTNLYGDGDNYNLQNSHVLPAMIRKFHEAKVNGDREVILWGSGSPMREFLHTDDLAEACLFLMNNYSSDQFLNIGTGIDVTIKELAEKVSNTVGFKGCITWDLTKPDGTPRKLMDVSKINALGWKHKIDLDKGIDIVYKNFLENIHTLRF